MNDRTMPDREISYRQAINEALHEEMERDDTVIFLGEDIAGAPQSDDPKPSGPRRIVPARAPAISHSSLADARTGRAVNSSQ